MGHRLKGPFNIFENIYRAIPAITNNRNIGSRKVNDTGGLLFPHLYFIADEITPHYKKNDATYYYVRAKTLRFITYTRVFLSFEKLQSNAFRIYHIYALFLFKIFTHTKKRAKKQAPKQCVIKKYVDRRDKKNFL